MKPVIGPLLRTRVLSGAATGGSTVAGVPVQAARVEAKRISRADKRGTVVSEL